MQESRIVYLSAGSNVGDRTAHLRSAISGLRAAGVTVTKISSVYETEPVGYLDQPWFLNLALEVKTAMSPEDLLHACLAIEAAHGRVRSFAGAPRTLDLDILLFDDLIVDKPELRIPHPRMWQRRFVLAPLAEIASGALHPQLQATIGSLFDSCPDPSKVRFHSKIS